MTDIVSNDPECKSPKNKALRSRRAALARNFPAHLTAKLGNIDSRNLTCAVALATLDRWNIPHVNGVAELRRSVVRNLRRAWFGSKGVRARPAGRGTMVFPLFDGLLGMEFAGHQTWGEAFGKPEPGRVRLIIKGTGR
jgi:hypothetical protein